MTREVSQLAQILRASPSIVFFGGAGVSTESGIPDFRSATGLYTTGEGGSHPPEYMLSHTCFARDTAAFYDFYRGHMLYPQARPNEAHKALARLEQTGRLQAVITQNIDGLHQMAGSKTVLELHGSVHRNLCLECHASYGLDFILASRGIPHCTACGGLVKPDVVLYEESLDQETMAGATSRIRQADTLIIGGTSLNVYPAAGLVQFHRGRHLILINRDPTPYDRAADLVLRDSIGSVLKQATQGLDTD